MNSFPHSIAIWIISIVILYVLFVVPGDESIATQTIVISILTSKNLHASLQEVSQDEFLITQSTLIQMVPSKTIHVSHQVVPGMDSLQHDSSCFSLGFFYEIVPRMTLHVSLYMVQGDEILATQGTLLWIH